MLVRMPQLRDSPKPFEINERSSVTSSAQVEIFSSLYHTGTLSYGEWLLRSGLRTQASPDIISIFGVYGRGS